MIEVSMSGQGNTRNGRVRNRILLEVAVISLGLLLMIVGFVALPSTPYVVSCTTVSCSPPSYTREARIVFFAGTVATGLGAIGLTLKIAIRRQRKPVC
jgi:hypothetical protein